MGVKEEREGIEQGEIKKGVKEEKRRGTFGEVEGQRERERGRKERK